jgi:hypothetical protein
MALKRIDITHKGDEWVAKSGGQVIGRSRTKTDLVRETASAARSSTQGTTVRIHGKNGRVQEERTYGKGADPRRSRG